MNAHVVELTDGASGSTARILVSLGFNCFSWRPVLDDGPREMLWAEAEFDGGQKRPSGSGIPLLFPFPGRIRGTSFRFAEREYALEPGDPLGNAIHGFVFNRPWRLVEQSEARAVGEFQASVDDPSVLERWPADFRIRVSYAVRGCELVSVVRYENTGDGPLPCGFATHAYFRLPLAEGSRVEETTVIVPVEQLWELKDMIPTGRVFPIPSDQRLAEGLRLNDHKFDTCFTGVRPDPDGLVRTQLADPATGRTVTQTFDDSFGQCVVYTPPHREAICLEPYTCVPDAVRLADEGLATGLQIIQPGEFRESTVRIDVNR